MLSRRSQQQWACCDALLGIQLRGQQARLISSAQGDGFVGFWTLSPERIYAFDAALRSVTNDELASKYDPVAMDRAGVYFAKLFVSEGQQGLEFLLENVTALRQFTASCAAAGHGAVRGMG